VSTGEIETREKGGHCAGKKKGVDKKRRKSMFRLLEGKGAEGLGGGLPAC